MDPSNNIRCKVCDDPVAKKSYNSIACSACRTFFARHSSLESIPIRCAASGNCQINYQNKHMNCASCRIKKCYEINMIRTDRDKSVVNNLGHTYNSYAPIKNLMIMYGEIMNNGFKIIGNLQNCRNTAEWIDRLAGFERHLLSPGGASPSSVTANTNMSIYDLVMFPGSCMDRSTRVADIFSESLVIPSGPPYKLRETALRIFVATIENMSLIDEFHLLPHVDKVRLVQQNGLMTSNCVLMYVRFSRGWGPEQTEKYLERFKLDGRLAMLWSNVVKKTIVLGRLDTLMSEIQPTEKEIMLLRVRSYFRPAVIHTDEGYLIIIQTRMKLTAFLGEHIRESNPRLTNEQVHARLCRILELEDLLKNVSTDHTHGYTALTTQQAFGFDTQLTHDIFVRNF